MTRLPVQHRPRSFWPELSELFAGLPSWPSVHPVFDNHIIRVEDEMTQPPDQGTSPFGATGGGTGAQAYGQRLPVQTVNTQTTEREHDPPLSPEAADQHALVLGLGPTPTQGSRAVHNLVFEYWHRHWPGPPNGPRAPS